MKSLLAFVSSMSLVCNLCSADLYMHNPRGSNNRLNEQTATRTNNNRMFDSQNNARGGYNVGVQTATSTGNNEELQYRMAFFGSDKNPEGKSHLEISWTNQHGCGGNEDTDPHKQNCNIVIQMMVQDHDENVAAPDDAITLRNGANTGTQNYNKISDTSTKAQFISTRNGNTVANKGLHEPWFYYDDCARRERNKGLFTATQDLKEDDARSTRQNPNGGRSGFECPEERDYYPYWHPTPFVDIAVLAQNESLCSYYEPNSANKVATHRCTETFANSNDAKHFSKYNNQADCEANGGEWTAMYNMLELAPDYTTQSECEQDHGDGMSYKWGKPYDTKKINNFEKITDVCFVQPPDVDCRAADWSRSNHLGNGRDGVPLSYTWTLPYFPSGKTKRVILRMRYNISTDDYDPYNTDSSSNGDQSPVQQNPLVDVGANAQALRLAINTAQTGRTFQDRSHVFLIKPRPEGVDATAHIINLNVQGKRGNIVQTFPAVEYDFIPNRLNNIRVGKDLIHIQWTGSNTHDNNAPGGDGQTGDAGEGTGGTDRHNILESLAADTNFPVPEESMEMFKHVEVKWSHATDLTPAQKKEAMALYLASGGHYNCKDGCSKSIDNTPIMQNQLNNVSPSFPGVLFCFTDEAAGKTYYYLCTRNNNFTNRSQKGHIHVAAEA